MTGDLWAGGLGRDGHADGEFLSALADGELGFDHPAGRHTAECPRCLTELDAFRVVREGLRGLPPVGLPSTWEDELIARVTAGDLAHPPMAETDTPASGQLIELRRPHTATAGVRRRAALVATAAAAIAAAMTISVLPKGTSVKPPMARLVVRHVTSTAGEDPSRLAPAAVPVSFGR
jgi:hypothetical protein